MSDDVKSTRRKAPKTESIMKIVKCELDNDPFTTCKCIQYTLCQKYNITVSKELVRLVIKKLKYSCKYAKFYGVSKNVIELNRNFLRLRDHYISKGCPLYSLDET